MDGEQAPRLHKTLRTIDIFSLSTGAMISSGLFVLPGILYGNIGPGILFTYLLASLLMVPAMLAKTELATAMPKAGGAYFYINKSIGPFIGTFSGFTSWFSLALKSAFALLGMGVFLIPIFPDLPEFGVKLIAAGFTLVFAAINIIGVKHSGKFQVVFVIILLGILVFYIANTLPRMQLDNIIPLLPYGFKPLLYSIPVVFISFGGLTKIASIAEEIKDPGKTIPKGMFSAFAVVTLLYGLTLFATSGVLSVEQFSSSLMPLSDGARVSAGTFGFLLLSIAGAAAFITTANAGILAASRTPLAMAEDNLLPKFFGRVNPKTGTPIRSILITAMFMIAVILTLDLEKLVKAASTMMLILFSLNCAAILLMRGSKISTYKPLFKMPLYPYLPAVGTILYIFLILDMGAVPLMITGGFFIVSIAWYLIYSRKRTEKDSALIHIVKNITNKELVSDALETELKKILIQRDDIVEDRFDSMISRATIIDLPAEEVIERDQLFELIAVHFSHIFKTDKNKIFNELVDRERTSTTVISPGLAIPHLIVPGRKNFDILILRSRMGIRFSTSDQKPVHQIFALAGTGDERNFHLQALMAIAQIVQNDGFTRDWLAMKNEKELKNLILLAKRTRQNAL